MIPLEKMKNTDKLLHSVSLTLGAVISGNWKDLSDDARMDLVAAFRNIRRHITTGTDGKRYGATEAWKMMQTKM